MGLWANTFLNGFIKETVYVEQPPGFEHEKFSKHVFKLKKVLYGLKRAPRTWYDKLKSFLLNSSFKMERADTTLFIKHVNKDILIIQIYVDDILFGSTNIIFVKNFLRLYRVNLR